MIFNIFKILSYIGFGLMIGYFVITIFGTWVKINVNQMEFSFKTANNIKEHNNTIVDLKNKIIYLEKKVDSLTTVTTENKIFLQVKDIHQENNITNIRLDNIEKILKLKPKEAVDFFIFKEDLEKIKNSLNKVETKMEKSINDINANFFNLIIALFAGVVGLLGAYVNSSRNK